MLLVLGRHLIVCPPSVSPVLNELTRVWKRGGWVGVDVFFVVSGFLISGLLFSEHARHGRISFPRFFMRRGFKIYPPFWALMQAALVMAALGFTPTLSGPHLLAELAFLQNYWGSVWSHTWSLAVEEHFYLALPLLLIALARAAGRLPPFRLLPLVYLVVAATCLGLRVLNADQPFTGETHLYPTHLRIDSLMLGVLLCWIQREHAERFRSVARRGRWPLAVAGVCLLAIPFRHEITSRVVLTVGLTAFALGAAFLLVGLIGFAPGPSWPCRILAFVGERSYSIYLWHMVVRQLAAGWARENWPLYVVTYLVGSILAGVIMAALVERPVLSLRDRLYPSRSASPPVPAAA